MEIRGSTSSTSLNAESVTSNGKKTLRESPVQLTSLSSLINHNRYFFLYQDSLVISKQKGPNTFKYKQRVRLEQLWIASYSNSDSFLIGWPLCNHLVHFFSYEEKEEWYSILSMLINQAIRPLSTTINMEINVAGRKQTIRRRIENGKKSAEIVRETAADLGLPDPTYELRIGFADNSNTKSLQGPENVYVVIMHELERNGVQLSVSQKHSLDTCPIANIRLILSNIRGTKGPSPKQFVNSIKKRVMQSREPRGLIGKELDGPTPPQPILTIVDHLRMNYTDIEGIFRKSPKQSTFKELRTELDRGLVPDFSKYSAHVLASMLKDYLRSIPGKLLLSANYHLWMREVVDEESHEKKLEACRTLLSLLPTSHCILLANVLKLLNKISQCEGSRMTSSSLSVCLGPCLIDSTDVLESGKKIPILVEFLIDHAAEVVPGFSADNVFAMLNATDENSNSEAHVDNNRSFDVCSPACLQIEDCTEENDDDLAILPTIEEEEKCDEDLPVRSNVTRTLSAFSSSSDEEGNDDHGNDSLIFRRGPPNRCSSDTASTRLVGDAEEDKEVMVRDSGGASSDLTRMEGAVPRKLSAELTERKKSDGPRSPCLKRMHFQKAQTEVHQKTDPFKFDNFERLKEKLAEAARLQERAQKEKAEVELLIRRQESIDKPVLPPIPSTQKHEEPVEHSVEYIRKKLQEKEQEEKSVPMRKYGERREHREQKNADTQTNELAGMESIDFRSDQWMSPHQRYRNSVLFDRTPESSPSMQRRSFANPASSLVHSMISQRFGRELDKAEKPTVSVQPFSQSTRQPAELTQSLPPVASPIVSRRLSQMFSDPMREDRRDLERDRRMDSNRNSIYRQDVQKEEPRESPVFVRRAPTVTPYAPLPPVVNPPEVTMRRLPPPPQEYSPVRKSCPEMPGSPVLLRKQMWEERCGDSPLATRRVVERQQNQEKRLSRQWPDPIVPSPRIIKKDVLPPIPQQQHNSRPPTFVQPTSLPQQQHMSEPLFPQQESNGYCPVRSEDLYAPVTSATSQEVRKSDLQRSLSTRELLTQRGEMTREREPQREVQRAGSVKSDREREWSRLLCKRTDEDRFVGMDPLEINWSVRHLKTLFHDDKAPNICTEYA